MRWTSLFVLLVAAALPGVLQANLSGQMDVMFDTLINVTEPTAHLGQRRGVLDGGSVVTRARIMNESLIQVVPPSLSAGCGGIDLFAGSFSFINADQFQDLLRAIAANAAGYAFEVALQNMCKTCADTMNYLQKVVQALNQGLGNSCQLAKGLVNAGADALNLAHKDKTSLETMTRGIQDAFESRSTVHGTGPAEALEASDPAAAKKLKGNLVWRALKTGGVSGWFKNGDDGLLEALMSVTGTVVIGELEQAPDGKGKSNTIIPKPPLVGIAEVLYGPRPEQGSKVRMYRCIPGNQDADGCLNPVEKAQGEGGEDGEFKGMIERVKQLMLGDAAKGQVGILEKLRFGSGTPSAAEASFMQILPIGAQLGNLARQNHGMAVQFAEAAAPIIATDLLVVMLRDMLRAVVAATTIADSAYASVLQDQIRAARAQLDAEQALLVARHGNSASLLQYYQTLLAQAKVRRYGSSSQAPNAQGTPR